MVETAQSEQSDTGVQEDSAKPRIEGGVDAVVVGGGFEGLVAAAYLARARLKTVLVEPSSRLGGVVGPRRISEDFTIIEGEHLLAGLEPRVAEDLDLYRYGLSFSSRRMATTYCLGDGDQIAVDGDLHNAGASLAATEPGASAFFEDVLSAAASLRETLTRTRRRSAAGETDPHSTSPLLEWMLRDSAEAVLSRYFKPGPVYTALLAEAAFRNDVAPHEPGGFASLLLRWGGETAGLQGAIGYPDGAGPGVIDACRRAAQKAGVDIRAGRGVSEILVEKDRVAGVALASGGQIRAPIVIAAMSARETFIRQIGPRRISSGFQQLIEARRARIGAIHYHGALTRALPADDANHFGRRFIYTPEPAALKRSVLAARRGALPDAMVVEAIFPAALNADVEPSVSVIAYPAPLDPKTGGSDRVNLRRLITQGLEKISSGLGGLIGDDALVLPVDIAAGGAEADETYLAAVGNVFSERARAIVAAGADAIGGLYYCGADAEPGRGMNGAAARAAALAALGKAARPGYAP